MSVRLAYAPKRSWLRYFDRPLLSVVLVSVYGAMPNDGVDDAPAIQRAMNASGAGDTIRFPSGVYDIKSEIKNAASNRTYEGEPGAILRGRTGEGQMLTFHGDNITIRGLTFEGGGLFIDKAGGGFNTNINIDNNVFKLNTSGTHPSAITFTSGLASSTITNNYFTGYTGGFGIYGYNYNGLTIANNEFVNVQAGMHIDAFVNSGNLVVEQNYVKGASGMGFEFQSRANNLRFQDNWFEHPSLSTTFSRNNNSMAYSLILDKSSNIVIQRNVVIAPERPDGVGTRIGFEVGGDNSLVEDNYVDGINHVLAMNDGVGAASVIVRNNKFKNYRQGISNSFPASNRTLTNINNGPDVQLTWDIGRGPPGRNRRFTGTGSIATGVSTPLGEGTVTPPGDSTTPEAPASTATVSQPTDLVAVPMDDGRILITWKDNSVSEFGFRIERSLDGVSWTQISTVEPDTTSFIHIALTSNTKVHYRVRAFGPSGLTEYTNVASATTLGSGKAPTTVPTTNPSTPVDTTTETDSSTPEPTGSGSPAPHSGTTPHPVGVGGPIILWPSQPPPSIFLNQTN